MSEYHLTTDVFRCCECRRIVPAYQWMCDDCADTFIGDIWFMHLDK